MTETEEFDIEDPHYMMLEDLDENGDFRPALRDWMHEMIQENYMEKNGKVNERKRQIQQAQQAQQAQPVQVREKSGPNDDASDSDDEESVSEGDTPDRNS